MLCKKIIFGKKKSSFSKNFGKFFSGNFGKFFFGKFWKIFFRKILENFFSGKFWKIFFSGKFWKIFFGKFRENFFLSEKFRENFTVLPQQIDPGIVAHEVGFAEVLLILSAPKLVLL